MWPGGHFRDPGGELRGKIGSVVTAEDAKEAAFAPDRGPLVGDEPVRLGRCDAVTRVCAPSNQLDTVATHVGGTVGTPINPTSVAKKVVVHGKARGDGPTGLNLAHDVVVVWTGHNVWCDCAIRRVVGRRVGASVMTLWCGMVRV